MQSGLWIIRLLYVLLLYESLTAAFRLDSIYTTSYDYGDRIELLLGNLRSAQHPNEQIKYYSLPFCKPKAGESVAAYGIGNILNGEHTYRSDYVVLMQINRQRALLCERSITEADREEFRKYIGDGYKIHMLLDNLPNLHVLSLSDSSKLHSFQQYDLGHEIGYINRDSQHVWLYTHLEIQADYKNSHVVGFRTLPDRDVDLDATNITNVTFTYDVKWQEGSSEQRLATRLDIYAKLNREPSSIYAYSILFSLLFILVTALIIVCSIRRRVISQLGLFNLSVALESIRQSETGVITIEKQSKPYTSKVKPEPGWRNVRYDVFRTPSHKLLLIALVSTGLQLAVALFSTCIFAYFGIMYIGQRGNVITASIVFYFVSSIINGYSSGRLFRKLQTKNGRPVSNFVLSYLFFPLLVASVIVPLNAFLEHEESSATISWNWLIILASSWFSISFFLSLISYYFAVRRRASCYPIRVNMIPRTLPGLSSLLLMCLILLSGGLSFLTCLLPITFIYSSVWGTAFSGMYTLLCISLVLWLFATSCFSLLIVFIQLNLEDWRWWWTSWLSGAAVGLYILMYSMYYYFNNTDIVGAVSTIIYFGYVLLISCTVSLISAAFSMLFCFYFLLYIYHFVRGDYSIEKYVQ